MAKSKELKVAIEAAKRAGEMLRKRFGERKKFQEKRVAKIFKLGRKSFQLKEDLKSERIIKRVLLKHFPEYGFLGEEVGLSSWEKITWIVDPLCGTVSYMHGLAQWVVSISLLKEDKILLGVIYHPLRDELFYAEGGNGSFLNQTRLVVSNTDRLEDSLISIEHKIFRLKKYWNNTTFKLLRKIRRLRVAESSNQEICYIACGRIDGLIKVKQPIYDYAAGKIILEEAGGMFTNFKGEEINIDLNPEVGVDLVASNGKIHGELLKYLQGK